MKQHKGQAITLAEVTPEWLTDVLYREGVLMSGSVIDIERHQNPAFNSHTLHIKPVYTTEATSGGQSVPARLLLKCSLDAEWAKRAGAKEVAFYQTVQSLPDHPPVIVRCYDAVHDGEYYTTQELNKCWGKSHLLLDDLSESHVIPVGREAQTSFENNLPTDEHLHQVVHVLARIHAYWWQNSLLGTGIAQIGTWCSDEAHIIAETERRRHAWNALLAQESEWFPQKTIEIYESLFDQLLPLWQRYTQPRLATFKHLTLTHGDAYLANFLCPNNAKVDRPYMIDWQSPEVYRGASDLVTMCATFWTREQRAEGDRELHVLQQYHHTLQENGVSDYAWDDLARDYQLGIIDWLFVALQDRMDGAERNYWWPKMQCIAHAFEDWRVADLFIDN